jgi:prolyl 4-hydroxylase
MIELHDDDIFTVDEVLDRSECREAIARAEAIGFADAPITTSVGFVLAPEIRNNTRVMVDDHALAENLWTRVAALLPAARPHGWSVAGLNERFRYYRYEAGQSFRWHSDGPFRRHVRERSFHTLMVYLNDDFTGGVTDFEGVSIQPRTGRALVFEHSLRHQGAAVRSGVKYVLRTDVMYRREGA